MNEQLHNHSSHERNSDDFVEAQRILGSIAALEADAFIHGEGPIKPDSDLDLPQNHKDKTDDGVTNESDPNTLNYDAYRTTGFNNSAYDDLS